MAGGSGVAACKVEGCTVECNTILDSTSVNWGAVGRDKFSTGVTARPTCCPVKPPLIGGLAGHRQCERP